MADASGDRPWYEELEPDLEGDAGRGVEGSRTIALLTLLAASAPARMRASASANGMAAPRASPVTMLPSMVRGSPV